MVIYSLAFSIGLLLAGILAWRLSIRQNEQRDLKPVWRDESLDEWRRQRELDAERERETRRETVARDVSPGSTRDEAETKKNQRIGG